MKKFIAWLAVNTFILIVMSPVAMAYITASGCDTSGLESCADEGTYLNCDPSIQSCEGEEEASLSEEDSPSSSSSSSSPSSEDEEESSSSSPSSDDAEQQNLQDNFISCDSEDILQMDDISAKMGAKNPSFVATELYEPIGSFDQKIKSGDVIVSQVFWKFNCSTDNPKDWTPKEEDCRTKCEWEVEPVPTKDHKLVKISGYSPYEKGCPDKAQCSIVQVIIGQSGTGILKTYVAIIYRWAASIVGIIAVLVIVISGIQISIDQGSGEGVTAAKNRITQSLAGLVILFLSALILYTINPTFFTK